MTTFHIQTAGYTANLADSEQMAGLLKQAKFELVETIEDADVVVFNTCIVKSSSENTFFSKLEQFRTEHPYKIPIIAGCIPQSDRAKVRGYSLIGTKQIHNVVQVVEEALHDNVLQLLSNDEMPPLNLPRVRKNPIVEILPINRGCLGACASCKTKKAQGNLVSYPVTEIIEAVTKAVKEGVKEIWLASHDTFCYGFDIGTDLPTLLEHLVKIEGDFKIKIEMGNAEHMQKIGTKLVELYKNPKIFKFLHLPLQAGHDETLKAMRRRYTVEEYLQTINLFKREIPEINIMTDIIVGYPTETDDHYWGTLEVVRKTTPDFISISSFWPRPDTPAANLQELPGEVVKHRSRVLTDIFHNVSKIQNERWVDWQGEILVDEKGKEEKQWIGRNGSYKQIIVEGDYKIGQILKVIITKAETFDLRGRVIS
ncbi:MAG TPA: tRNA (N(6)-L-threonylcarbamoyladenosine(37)-C(2))-methylthiotransferase [Candidatus Nanoarchaeia archaeon]|nr:tRNA (N(6)-L-threonylcarbamoyladenosine(37)-C(2))-methylthiotransferase [Candidatus Nanoarchaeia archaeon]